MAELDDYKVEYYSQKLSPKEMIFKKLLENSDTSPKKSKVLLTLNGLARLYEKLTRIQVPKALLTCKDCLVDLD